MQESARAHIEARLAVLGWTDPVVANRPFRTPGITKVVSEFIGLDGSRQVAAGTTTPLVSVSIPSAGVDDDIEIGGPGVEATYDLFVSVLATPALVGVLTEDIVDLLAGRVARPIIPFLDKTTGLVVVGETLELEGVSSDRARLDRDDWMLITATVVRTFNRDWS